MFYNLLHKKRLPFLVYFVGMVPLGYFQHSVRMSLGDILAFVVAAGYLVALRLLGLAVVRILDWREKVAIDRHNAAVAATKEARTHARLTKSN